MPEPSPHSSGSVSLPDLIALNDEIIALLRAGVPLETGLGTLGSASRKLRRLSHHLAARLRDGGTLADAFQAAKGPLPAAYVALIETGLKTDRLADAMTAMSAFGRRMLDVQRQIRLALWYPCLLLAIAYGLFIGFLTYFIPRMTSASDSITQGGSSVMAPTALLFLRRLAETMPAWGPAIPIAAILLGVLSGLIPFPRMGEPIVLMRRLRWMPWLGRIVRNAQLAGFADLLGILVERMQPLPDALVLASAACGDKKLARECRRISQRLNAGDSFADSLRTTRAFSPFLRWMLEAGEKQNALAAVSRQLADSYRRRAQSQTEWFTLVAPVVLTIVVGGGAVAAYGLALFLPMRELLINLTAPVG